MVKSYEQGPSATVAAVSVDAGKYVANEASGRIAGHYLEKALEQTAENSVVIHYALGEISRWSAILSDTARLRARTRYKATRELAKSEQAFSQAVVRREAASNTLKTAGRFARGIPVVFAAWDIWDAWGDYMATQTDAGAH